MLALFLLIAVAVPAGDSFGARGSAAIALLVPYLLVRGVTFQPSTATMGLAPVSSDWR
jgi:phosphotransferase system  glucose/maltose/N-acetylglucosamine-specific IIC component